MELILIRPWEVCENAVQPQPGDWTKAPGSFHRPCLHKQPFVPPPGVMGSQDDWLWGLGLFFSQGPWMDYSPWSNSESSFTRLLPLSLSVAAQLLARLRLTEGWGICQSEEKLGKEKSLMASFDEVDNRGRLKGKNKTDAPVCQRALESPESYYVFEIFFN